MKSRPCPTCRADTRAAVVCPHCGSPLQGTAKTSRMRRIECTACPDGYAVRASRSMIARGLPVCPCGARMIPAALEDAEHAHAHGHLTADELAAHPEAETFAAECSSVAHGQAGPGRHRTDGGAGLRAIDAIALERVYRDRAATAAANRIQALRDHAYGPTPDEIPF
jgi:hypothetical protein